MVEPNENDPIKGKGGWVVFSFLLGTERTYVLYHIRLVAFLILVKLSFWLR